jgi:hypothetical protein
LRSASCATELFRQCIGTPRVAFSRPDTGSDAIGPHYIIAREFAAALAFRQHTAVASQYGMIAAFPFNNLHRKKNGRT